MTDEKTDKIYRHKVIKVITDNPGQVVYADEIVEKLIGEHDDITTQKVGGAVRRFKNTYPDVGNEIQVVVPAQAWRYVPNKKVTQSRVATTPTRSAVTAPRPPRVNVGTGAFTMTGWLREYFTSKVNELVYLVDLRQTLNEERAPLGEEYTASQVTVGIANARAGDELFRERLLTVISGRAWMYRDSAINPATVHETVAAVVAASGIRPTTPMSPAVLPPRVVVPAVAATNDDTGGMMIVEKIGTASDGALLVRDEDNRLYRLSPI